MLFVPQLFERLPAHKLAGIKTIVWDLDGTLGKMPGWDGNTPLCEYIDNCGSLTGLLQWLAANYGIRHLLVSRNGMFCDSLFVPTRDKFRRLGFHGVLPCYRRREHSKVFALQDLKTVLLVDDQLAECEWAVRDGASAMHVHAPVFTAGQTGQFTVIVPQAVHKPWF